MKTYRKDDRNPAAKAVALVFAIVAAVLLLVRVAIDGGMQSAAVLQAPALPAVVIGMASAGVLAVAADNSSSPGRSGLPARAREAV